MERGKAEAGGLGVFDWPRPRSKQAHIFLPPPPPARPGGSGTALKFTQRLHCTYLATSSFLPRVLWSAWRPSGSRSRPPPLIPPVQVSDSPSRAASCTPSGTPVVSVDCLPSPASDILGRPGRCSHRGGRHRAPLFPNLPHPTPFRFRRSRGGRICKTQVGADPPRPKLMLIG